MGYKCIVGPYGTHGHMYVWSNNANNRYSTGVSSDVLKSEYFSVSTYTAASMALLHAVIPCMSLEHI